MRQKEPIGRFYCLRFLLKSNFVKAALVYAKSRVSLLRKMTIPRLEVLGNPLLSQLISNVTNNLTSVYSIDKICAWTDSSIAYHGYRILSKVYKSFIKT